MSEPASSVFSPQNTFYFYLVAIVAVLAVGIDSFATNGASVLNFLVVPATVFLLGSLARRAYEQ